MSNPSLEDEIYLITLLYTSDHGLANIASIGFMTDKKRKSQELIENSPLFCHFLDDVFGFFFCFGAAFVVFTKIYHQIVHFSSQLFGLMI